jgi:Iron-sulfur cluster binding domain of dihydroorotate dehydrogenase B
MQETEAIIERVWQVSPQIQRLELTVETSLAQLVAGQSLLVQPKENQSDPYLREHWIPVDLQEGQLIIERSAESHYSPGQVVSVLGPIGQGMPWVGGGNKHLLLVALDTPPTPLLMLAAAAAHQTAEVALVLLGKAVDYPFAGIPSAVEVINGNEDYTWRDQAATVNWADQVFAAVDESFWQDHFTSLFHLVKNIRTFVPVNFLHGVFTLPLPCGTGACTACMVRAKTGSKLICTQGPALDLTEVQLL